MSCFKADKQHVRLILKHVFVPLKTCQREAKTGRLRQRCKFYAAFASLEKNYNTVRPNNTPLQLVRVIKVLVSLYFLYVALHKLKNGVPGLSRCFTTSHFGSWRRISLHAFHKIWGCLYSRSMSHRANKWLAVFHWQLWVRCNEKRKRGVWWIQWAAGKRQFIR